MELLVAMIGFVDRIFVAMDLESVARGLVAMDLGSETTGVSVSLSSSEIRIGSESTARVYYRRIWGREDAWPSCGAPWGWNVSQFYSFLPCKGRW